jgi:hypothetical protein
MALHYQGRVAFTQALLPLLEKTANNGNDVRVMSVLASGVHPSYVGYASDPLLENNYSLKNCAGKKSKGEKKNIFAILTKKFCVTNLDGTTFYNDLAANSFALQVKAPVSFIHINPGAVATNWGRF